MSLNEKLQHKYALSKKGAQDLIKAFVSVTVSDIVLMISYRSIILSCKIVHGRWN